MTYDPVSGCGDSTDSLSVLDWSHVSAISFASVQGVYIISLRNLDTVVSFAKDGSGVDWVLSSHADALGKRSRIPDI